MPHLPPIVFTPLVFEGNHFLLVHNALLAEKTGIPKDHILLGNNGQVMEFTNDQGRLTDEYVPTNLITVDGTGVGEVGGVVLNDRTLMAENGIFVLILHLDKQRQMIGSPDIISRGFIYMKEAETLMSKVRDLVKQTYTEQLSQAKEADAGELKTAVRKTVEKHLFQETGREPMVLPVFIQD